MGKFFSPGNYPAILSFKPIDENEVPVRNSPYK